MEHSKKGLSLLLLKQAEVQKKLLALEVRKTQVLLKGFPEELNGVLNAQQPFLMHASNLENQRESRQKALGLEKSAMRRIVEHPENEEERLLAESFTQLKDAVEKLKKASDLNRRILEARMDTKKNLLRIFHVEDEMLTYSK